MNSLRNSVGAAAVQVLSRMMDQPSQTKPRRFCPLAESMEARALLSHVALTQLIIDPIAVGRGTSAVVVVQLPSSEAIGPEARSHVGPGPMKGVEVNGQVEIQPDDAVRV